MVGAYLLEVTGIVIILLNQSIAWIYVFLILYGFGSGANILVRIMIEGRYFGRKAFASILGSTMLITAPISMIAPIYTGWIFDQTGNYNLAFILFAIFQVCASLLVCFIPSPRPPEQTSEYRKFM